MTGEQAFDLWAPPSGRWSPWVVPTLFAAFRQQPLPDGQAFEPVLRLPVADPQAVLVIDAPGEEAVRLGMAAAAAGYVPVPVFNVNALGAGGAPMAVAITPLIHALGAAADRLKNHDGPPAFLLDALRMGKGKPAVGTFDNRWQTTPQDFPSARHLREQGMARVLWLCPGAKHPPADLAHVLRRWHEDGLPILMLDAASGKRTPLVPPRPAFFGWAIARTMVFFGLRRNAAGGFGSVVPEAHGSGG